MNKNNDLELINRLSRKKLSEDEVYIFPITLCDNEIDRDNEAFTIEALKQLGELFVGKTGINDHSMRSKDQTARIFTTWIEENHERKTKRAEIYTALKAKAYMVRTDKNKDLIKEIDAGIKKEVSVSCALKNHKCSICGKEKCQHIKGKTYNDELCCTLLSEATDAYEWSFVAVPAQREAGVTKTYKNRERKNNMDTFEIIRSAFSDREEMQTVCDYIAKLEKQAIDGKNYREELSREIKKLFCITVPELSQKTVSELCENIGTDSLRELKNTLAKKKSTLFPCAPQTAKKSDETSFQSDSDYKI